MRKLVILLAMLAMAVTINAVQVTMIGTIPGSTGPVSGIYDRYNGLTYISITNDNIVLAMNG